MTLKQIKELLEEFPEIYEELEVCVTGMEIDEIKLMGTDEEYINIS